MRAAVTAMIMAFFPLKKLRRNGKHLLFVAILLVGAVAVYNEMSAAKAWNSENSGNPNAKRGLRAILNEKMRRDHQPDSSGDSNAWISSYSPQTWKPEYRGQANLHAFEDWCGSSTADLRKNPHYPLYPHSRTTVQKLAVSPQWTNYGLRIFGYLHPYTDGDYVFALSSDDNSEFWLSTDDSPLNLQLLAWVGKMGTEWTAPGEFEKYASQTSRPVWLSIQRRYFFEVIHKQNDRGVDHVEVAWQLLDQGLSFMVIGSRHISLYVNESDLLVSDVAHIPQTAASHQHTPTKHYNAAADILTEDPRDTFYKVHLINSNFLNGVLPDCSYSPSYTIKDYPLSRYQGLQFVHLSYIYPNDYTRLTHMEKENSCFYADSPLKMKLAFSRYMRLDPGTQERGNEGRKDSRYNWNKSSLDERFDKTAYKREMEARLHQRDNNLFPDYGDDYDDYVQNRRRKLFSLDIQETSNTLDNSSDTKLHMEKLGRRQPEPGKKAVSAPQQHTQQNHTKLKQEAPIRKVQQIKPKRKVILANKQKVTSAPRPGQNNPAMQPDKEPRKPKQLQSKRHQIQRSHKIHHRFNDSQLQNQERNAPLTERPSVIKQRGFVTREKVVQPVEHFITLNKGINRHLVRSNQGETDPTQGLRVKEIVLDMPVQDDLENSIHRKVNAREKMDAKWPDMMEEWDQGLKDSHLQNKAEGKKDTRKADSDLMWGPGEDYEGPEEDEDELRPAVVFDPQVRWNQTFQVNHLDLQAQRSDEIDLRCPISGSLLLHSSDALPVVEAFMDNLNKKHYGQFTLVRVVNVVKRVDWAKGARYLLELELKDRTGQLLRLSHYIYVLIRNSIHQRNPDFGYERSKPQPLLCNPVGFHWNPGATVHIIVPVKNQARWVQQLITDMEELFRETRDTNFKLIISDFSSTDMDIRKALQKSSIHRYQYLKLSGNFERASGLQAGIDQINDDHSIVFLCDLHLHFPSSIIDSIRKHCVEGHMAFAPIVMRLDCGSTPSEARGFWEVNGFGLLGIYKSDLDRVGGMNTKEFKDRWGGEDWELLDRIIQAGLEVDRIYLRNFFHRYHSKRGMWNRRMSTGFK